MDLGVARKHQGWQPFLSAQCGLVEEHGGEVRSHGPVLPFSAGVGLGVVGGSLAMFHHQPLVEVLQYLVEEFLPSIADVEGGDTESAYPALEEGLPYGRALLVRDGNQISVFHDDHNQFVS